jgi:hypothetical protein
MAAGRAGGTLAIRLSSPSQPSLQRRRKRRIRRGF